MTTRQAAYLVVLDEDVREDEIGQPTLTAIRMIKGVISVTPVVSDHAQVIARSRRDRAWETALLALVKEGPSS
jgi:hypothetical protein